MKPSSSLLFAVIAAACAVTACAAPAPATPDPLHFDYFKNSWNVIALKDYRDGTRVTPANELLLAGGLKLRLSLGSPPSALGPGPTKVLLEGWLPVILLQTNRNGIRYELSLWATPLPSVRDWRAAFDWPTEGENFLNWIQVKAVNLGASPATACVRVDQVGTNTSFLGEWSQALAPGRSAQTCFRVPFAPVADAQRWAKEDPRVWLDRTVAYWHGVIDRGARIEVPCVKATQTLRAAHVCQLIANDHGVLHAGEGFYDEFYLRDGGYQLLELEEAGLWEPARLAVSAYLTAQRPDGRFETQSDQFDANGQALWTLWQYAKISGNTAWLERAYPAMRRAAQWIQRTRHQSPPDSAFAGLLPPAPADGEFLWDGHHHIVGYDFWNLRGLLCTADAARMLGETNDARVFEDEAADYRRAIDAAWQRTVLPYFPPSWEKAGTPWGNTETLWPTELFAPNDARVTSTLAEVREHHGGGFAEGTIRWTGQPNVIHPYLSAYTTMASLIRGDSEQFVEEFYWYLLHSSASHAFPEGIFFKRRYAWSETIPHVLGAANFAFLLRHALIHERGDELHLLAGVPDWWLEPSREIRVLNAPTHFGPMSLEVRGTPAGLRFKLDLPRRHSPSHVVLHLPVNRQPLALPAGVTVAPRPPQGRRWDFPAVVAQYQASAAAPARPIPGLVSLPLATAVDPARCRLLDLASVANTDPFNAPFGVVRPGKYLFTGLATGTQSVAGIPFRLVDPGQNQGRGLVVLNGADASASFPREVTIPVGQAGSRLFFLGNVHGYCPDDDGSGSSGAVAEYVIHYADGQTQSVPLISHRTADDWASEPDATDAQVGVRGDPWHLNLLAVTLRPVAVERIVFRDLGTPAAPVLAAVTLEQ
jgi:hypothetical protein